MLTGHGFEDIIQDTHMKDATQKLRNFKTEVNKAQENILVACCSSAIDLIFTDASVTAEVGGQPVKGSSIRLKQTGKTCISILGLDPRAVNKETTPGRYSW